MSTDLLAELRDVTTRKVAQLQGQYLASHGPGGSANGTLAALRRAAGSEPGDDPVVWEFTLGDLPEALHGHGYQPSRAERAVHAALTLYAVHQQSRQTGMHLHGRTFGHAAGRLTGANEAESAVRRRFDALATADSFEEVRHYARTLVTQFRVHDIPLDYGIVATDFFLLQSSRCASDVRLRWGRDFYATRPSRSAEASESSATNASNADA